jgi:hypothetical protein
LHAIADFITFASVPAFAGAPAVLAVLLVLTFLLFCVLAIVGSHGIAVILVVACC